jgi:hypothetical protein
LETVAQVAEEGVVQVLEHAPLSNDVANTLGAYHCCTTSASVPASMQSHIVHTPSSFRMYLSAKVRPVSFRSTMRTLPNAPLPTTRSSRKWLRFTAGELVTVFATLFLHVQGSDASRL